MGLDNQVAIITGSSEGIGLSVALLMAKTGATVVINGRDGKKLRSAEEMIMSQSSSAVVAFKGDITKSRIRKDIVNETVKNFRKIDILINNAGGGSNIWKIEDVTDDEWQRTLDFNLNSCFSLCREVIPHMRLNQYGRIVNVSSVAARFKGRLSGPQYSAAKAGLQGMTRYLAWELAKDGITVNSIAPGFVSTQRALLKWERISDVEKEQVLTQIPIHRFANPEEIASPIVFLASPASSYITGVTLDVNGGYYMA